MVVLPAHAPLSRRRGLPAPCGIEVSIETIRCWTLKFGGLFAHNLRRSGPKPFGRWHLDEMLVRIGGKRVFPWRAVGDEGEVLAMLVQERRSNRHCVITPSAGGFFSLVALG